MKRKIIVVRINTGLIAALAALMLGSVPSGAENYIKSSAQEIPWYLPQPWVAPPQTGPKFRPLPGQYGHNYRNFTYGSFSRNCFGDCRYLPGMVRTGGYHLILRRPAVVIFDPRQYRVVPRTEYQPPRAAQPAATFRTPRPTQPAMMRVDVAPDPAKGLQRTFTIQNGVRIFRPSSTAP